jgi:hypothetical protein
VNHELNTVFGKLICYEGEFLHVGGCGSEGQSYTWREGEPEWKTVDPKQGHSALMSNPLFDKDLGFYEGIYLK